MHLETTPHSSLLQRWYNLFIFPETWHGIHLPALVPYIGLLGILAFALGVLPFLIWIERVAVALMQDRIGPNRVGPRGLLQPAADVLKLFMKEDVRPRDVDRLLYYLAPFLSMTIAISTGAVLPWASVAFRSADGHIFTVPLTGGNINVALLFALAMSSLSVYGLVLAGWSSNNKYSLLGGLRASAQVISYELAMGLALLCVVLLAGSLNLGQIVEAQNQMPFGWHLPALFKGSIFSWFWLQSLLVPVGLYTIAMIAETNRPPFDLPEAESELVAGYHTEYSAMKFATFFAAEYINMLLISGLNATIFWGGWLPPFHCVPFTLIPGFVWFGVKVMMGIYLYVWLRASLPRLRYDALMQLGWKRMLPLGLFWLFLLGGYSLLRAPRTSPQQEPAAMATPAPTVAPTPHHSIRFLPSQQGGARP